MNALIVYAHPNPRSHNRELLDTALQTLKEAGHEVRLKDLYAMDFAPVLSAADFEALERGEVPEDIAREQQDLLWAQALIFFYPLWWYGRPAILKGWVDRVLQHGFAFRAGPDGVDGLLGGRKALIVITAGGSKAEHEATDAVDLIHRPMSDGTLRFCGVEDVDVLTFWEVPSATSEQRATMLADLRTRLSALLK